MSAASGKRTVLKVAEMLYDQLGQEACAIVLVYPDGNHAFAKWGGTEETNTKALLNAALHITQDPERKP